MRTPRRQASNILELIFWGDCLGWPSSRSSSRFSADWASGFWGDPSRTRTPSNSPARCWRPHLCEGRLHFWSWNSLRGGPWRGPAFPVLLDLLRCRNCRWCHQWTSSDSSWPLRKKIVYYRPMHCHRVPSGRGRYINGSSIQKCLHAVQINKALKRSDK